MADFIEEEVVWGKKHYSLASLREEGDSILPAIIKITSGYFGLTDLETFSSDDVLFLYSWHMEERVMAMSQNKGLVSIPIDSEHRFRTNTPRSPVMSLETIMKARKPPIALRFTTPGGNGCNVQVSNEEVNLGTITLKSSHFLEYVLASTTAHGEVCTNRLLWVPIYRKVRFVLASVVNGMPVKDLKEHLSGYLFVARTLRHDDHHPESQLIEEKIGIVYYSEMLDILEDYDYIRTVPMGTWGTSANWMPTIQHHPPTSPTKPTHGVMPSLQTPPLRQREAAQLPFTNDAIERNDDPMTSRPEVHPRQVPMNFPSELLQELVTLQREHNIRPTQAVIGKVNSGASSSVTDAVTMGASKSTSSSQVYARSTSMDDFPTSGRPKLTAQHSLTTPRPPPVTQTSSNSLPRQLAPTPTSVIRTHDPPSQSPMLMIQRQEPVFASATPERTLPTAVLQPISQRIEPDGSEKCSHTDAAASIQTIGDIPQNINDLSVIQICECLKLLNMDEFVPKFAELQINGALLCTCSPEDLVAEFGMGMLKAKKLNMFSNDGWRPVD